MFEIAWAFSLPGQWVAVDTNTVDFDPATGELTLPMNLFGFSFNEISVTYTAGLSTIGDDVKSACAQIVRNAQSSPGAERQPHAHGHNAIGVLFEFAAGRHGEAWLRPYVANRWGER